ncbi:MAG: hypothetical protein NZ771_02920 [Candidatus Marinimicrobia bacterium]|nr:hypothetical protein [Candidatus Neomarinimicrobiota bacterium]
MGQDASTDSAKWKHYVRGGGVQVTNDNGLSGYYRLNRSSNYSFGDLRLYLYGLRDNSYVFIRYKSSSKYRKWPRFYRFSTIAYQKNTKAGVALRYHFNQGLGLFVLPYSKGHIITEIAHAYDMSDYLNDNRRTSYARGGLYWDHDTKLFNTKLEVEYFYQISEEVEENLSRTQAMAEVIIPITKGFSAIIIYEIESYRDLDIAVAINKGSMSFSLGWKGTIPWTW